MTDENFGRIILRAFLLNRAGNADASQAVMSGSHDALDTISDNLVRELYGFFNGVASGLEMCGRPEGLAMLDFIQKSASGDDVTTMRQTLKGLFDELRT